MSAAEELKLHSGGEEEARKELKLEGLDQSRGFSVLVLGDRSLLGASSCASL